MENITINFHDFSPVSWISPEEKELLRTIWPEETSEERCIQRLCQEIQVKVKETKAKNIHMLNTWEEKVPCLFGEFGGELCTQGYVGMICIQVKGIPVTINFRSRFDDGSSYFLMYLFEKAFGMKGKIYEELSVKGTAEKSWDFLLMLLFVKQLHEAMKKGTYKQYQEFCYNDSNVKGRIDVAEYIRKNIPANGKISYCTREFTINNPVNQLILKACEILQKKYRQLFGKLLAEDEVCKKGIQLLKSELYGESLVSDREAIKNAGKKIVQPVYKEYEPLRKTAIAVLKRLGVNGYKSSKESAEGLLIDMPGLWERFLHKEIFCKAMGVKSEYRQEGYDILEGKRTLKPDFLFQEQRMVFDAKYKQHWEKDRKSVVWNGAREDVFQILSYMYAFDCSQGGVIFPVRMGKETELPEMENYIVGQSQKEAVFWLIPVPVPEEENTALFRRKMDAALETVKETMQNEFRL